MLVCLPIIQATLPSARRRLVLRLARIPIPCRRERYTATGGPDTWWPTLEPAHRVNQIYLEPIMFSHAASISRLSILNRTRVIDFEQKDANAIAITEDLTTGKTREISAAYLVGCDGAHSEVRHKIRATMSGDVAVSSTQSTYISAPKLLGMMPGPAWLIVLLSPCFNAFMFAIDGRERWLIHNYLRPVWRWIWRGTHTGSLRGIPPTGHRVEVPGCKFIELRGDQVLHVDGYFHRLTMLTQLGVAPE
jgi:2-polyprenyl-6-methoxyphenol hydroxylase-like FAD-dependent oxidoreductase